MKSEFYAIGLAALLFSSPVPAEELWTAAPFDRPESAIFDPEHRRIVVSVIGGDPSAEDGNGVLALVSPTGEILDPAWVSGLDAPKGMALVGDALIVADIAQIRVIDRETGEIRESLTGPGVMSLNDATSDGTVAYFSDTTANAIWRYKDGDFSLWLQNDDLSLPNGLLLDGDRMLVASWGVGVKPDFSTEAPGSLFSVDLATQDVSVVAPELGNLDGVVRIGDSILANDWIAGKIFEISADGASAEVGQYPTGLADIAAHGNMLLMPSMLEGAVRARTYP